MSKRRRSAYSAMSSKKGSRRRPLQEEEDDDDVLMIDLEPDTTNGNSRNKGIQNGASCSKKTKMEEDERKGGGDSRKKKVDFGGTQLIESKDQPGTGSKNPGTGPSLQMYNVPRRQNQGLLSVPAPSTSSVEPERTARGSEKTAESVPTADQLMTTRLLRQAFVEEFQNSLEDVNNNTPVPIEDLLNHLHHCLKIRPFVFATRSMPEARGFEDVSEDPDPEVAEFAHWWFFSLTAVLFSCSDEAAKTTFLKMRDVLADLCQLLVCGHPSVAQSMGVQFIIMMMDLLERNDKDVDAVPMLKLTLAKTDFTSTVKKNFNYDIRITKGNEWLLPHYFHAISPIIARLYFRDVRFSRFFQTFLLKFAERIISPGVVAAILDALPCHLLTTGTHWSYLAEDAVAKIFKKIVEAPTSPGTNSLEIQLLFHEQQQLQNNRWADFFQDSCVYRLQDGLRSFLYSDKFYDANKNGVGDILMTLIEFVVHGTPRASGWTGKEVSTMFRKVSSKGIDKIFHPILQQVIMSEFLLYWNKTNTEKTPRQVQSKGVSSICSRIFELWEKSLKEHLDHANSSEKFNVQMTANDETKVVTFFERTSALVKFVKTLAQQLKQQGRRERYLFFELEQLRDWSNGVSIALANAPRMSKIKLQGLYFAILDTLEHLDACRWFGVQLPPTILNELICIPGLPWLKAFDFAIPQRFKPIQFSIKFSPVDLQFIKGSSVLTSKAIRALRLEEFRPWSFFVSEIYNSVMADPATTNDPFLVSELLFAIADVSWIFKEVIDLQTTFTFLNKVISTTLWVVYAFVRSSLASAISALPCICSYNCKRNRPDYKLAVPLVSRSGCEKRKCPKNYVPKSEDNNSDELADIYIKAIVQLALPLLQGKFLLAKMTLSDLIIACHNHVTAPSESIVLPMIEVALNANVVLCQEIFRKVGLVVMNCVDTDSITQRVFSVAIPQIRKLKEQKLKKRLPLKTLERIMEGILAFSIVGPMTNMSIFVEIMRCVIPLVALSRGNEISVTIFAQKIVTHFAEVHKCQPYELMSRARKEISKCIVQCALKEFHQIGEKQVNLCAKFIEKIKYIGKFGCYFSKFFYPPLMELVVPHLREEDAHYRFILTAMVSARNDAKETERTLLEEFIIHYFPTLLLDYQADTVSKCLRFLKIWYAFDAMFVAKQQEQRILNEAICRLNDRQEKVLSLLPLLCKWDAESSKTLSTGYGKSVPRSELQELLNKRLLGFFIHLDTKLQSRIETVRSKEKIVQSFTTVMNLMGKSKITPVRFRVYQTLFSATKDVPQLHIVLCDAWKEFAANLDNASFTLMTTQILASILPLRQISCLRKKVDELISHFVCFKKDLTAERHQELYFLLGQCDDQDVIKVIGNAVTKMKDNNWSDYFNMVVREASNDNPPIRCEAFKKLREIFRHDWELIEKFVLVKGKDYISQIISTLLAGLRGTGSAPEDAKLREIIVECFGAMGALDPVRFRSIDDDAKSKNSLSTSIAISSQMNSFVVLYLSELCREFQEVKDTTNFDNCACLIQIVLKEFKVSQTTEDRVWKFLSEENQELITHMFATTYKVEHGTAVPDLSIPIYLSDHGRTFNSWLINWMCYLIMCITEKEKQAFDLFRKSMNMLKTNVRITTFIIPFVTMYAIFCATEDQRRNIVMEIQTVLECWVVLDQMKRKANTVAPVRDSEVDSGVMEEETTMEKESVFHNKCTQVVFSVLDHLLRSSSLARRRWTVKRAAEQRGGSLRSIMTPPMTEYDLRSVESVLKEIQPLLISEVAYNCMQYPMAMYYLEQDLKNSPSEENLQKNVDYLQNICICLEDMDSVRGVTAIRKGHPKFAQQILENLVEGKTHKSVKELEEKVSRDQDDFQLHQALIRGYLKVEEPHAAQTFIKSTLERIPGWKLDLQEVQMQTLVKLQQWSDLHTTVDCLERMEGNESLEDKFLTWNVAIPRVMSKMQRSQLDAAIKVVTDLKSDLTAPLVATSEEMYPYKQAYPLIVKTHILTEIDDSIILLRKFEKSVLSGENAAKMNWLSTEVSCMVNKWETRLRNVNSSRSIIDQVSSVHKSLFEIMKGTFQENNTACETLNNAIRTCWLNMVKDANKFGDFTTANNCIIQAKEYMSPQVMIAEAKVHRRKGEKERAIRSLQHGITQWFPESKTWKTNRIVTSSSHPHIDLPRLQCSKALLLYAKLCEETKILDMDDQVRSYRDAVNVYAESEKNWFILGNYHDSLWAKSSRGKNCLDIQQRIVTFYARSLHYGCRYVYQSLPRLLSIWFDLAAALQRGQFTRFGCSGIPDSVQGDFAMQTNETLDAFRALSEMEISIKRMTTTVPAYILMTAFSQLVSRLCHAHQDTWAKLKDILVQIISTHPSQTLWLTMAVYKSVNQLRRTRCLEIFRSVEQKDPSLRRIIKEHTDLTESLIDLCNKTVPERVTEVSLNNLYDKLPKLIGELSGRVAVPFQVFMNPTIPRKGVTYVDHNPYPQQLVFICGIVDTVEVMRSLVRPKKITIRASNGKKYGLLCKPKDDLRKDSKVMEVNNVVNWYLSQNPDSSQRSLHVKTYSVVPLNEECGLLEWVPNLTPFRHILTTLYKEKNIQPFRGKSPIQKDEIGSAKPAHVVMERNRKFVQLMLKPTIPVFSDWFFNNFNDHQSWYSARMSYMRTAAVISIVGYIMGLGDRHGENFLLDRTTGEVVHVDFNCIFNKGESFDWPELVPFRLTQNMVEGMGPLGHEGVFRKSCEIVLNMFREHRSMFLSILRPFVFDPLVEWQTNERGTRGILEAGESTNEKAVDTMKNIRRRLNGTGRVKSSISSTELSVEAHVNYLIEEATSVDNLSQMWIGWAAHM